MRLRERRAVFGVFGRIEVAAYDKGRGFEEGIRRDDDVEIGWADDAFGEAGDVEDLGAAGGIEESE